MVREMERPHSRELQPQSYWLRVSPQAHMNMIGGVPKAVVCDNLGSCLTARAWPTSSECAP
jgi:hypothetical protein